MNCKLLVCLLLALPFAPARPTLAQGTSASPYEFHWKTSAIRSSGAVVFAGMGYFSRKQVSPHSEATVHELNRYDLPGFDRSTVDNWRPSSARASDYMLYASAAMPLLMLADRNARQDWLGLGMMYVEVAGFTLGITELAKGVARRNRPFAYNPDVPMEERLSPDARMSFFSGHTSMTTAMCFLTAKVFSDYSDNRTASSLVWTAAVLTPAVVAYLRVDAGKHFPSDVIAGYLVGGAIGYLIPELHKRNRLPKGMTLAPFGSIYGTGLHLSYGF